MSEDDVKKKRFYSYMKQTEIINDQQKEESILKVQLTNYNQDNRSQIMIQIIDISNSVSLDEKIMEN